jgi:Cu(I)/Ag(I) efflux system membrane fusion protein
MPRPPGSSSSGRPLPGKYVEPGTTLYEVADLSTVWISADIYESEVAAVRRDQPAFRHLRRPSRRQPFSGNGVVHVYPSLNTEARTVRACGWSCRILD